VQAQRNRDGIKGAGAQANTGVGRNAGKLPPDSMKWVKGGNASLNFSQTDLSNWAAGGEKSLSLSSSSNLFANYKKNKMIWENYSFMAYGIVKAGDRDAVKNSDQINIGSRVGYQMAQKGWYYTAAMLGKTQFAPGYRYGADTIRTSDFLAPAYLYLTLGFDYKPSSRLFISFAPAMGKATFVRSNNHIVLISAIPQVDKEGKSLYVSTPDGFDFQGNNPIKARYEFGGGIVFNINGSYFSKRVTYTTQLELFSNYFDKPQNIDVIWDFQFRVALTKFVSAQVRLNMMYFDSQKTFTVDNVGKRVEHGPSLQVREYFEIGLFYGF
jgi:hypothetical protein